MLWRSLNIDEVMYRIHLFLEGWIWDPLVYIFTLQWIFGSRAALTMGQGNGFGTSDGGGFLDGIFGSTIFRIFNSRPSSRKDSVEELLDPTDEKGWFEYIADIFLGTSDQESLLSILFTTPLGWLVLLSIFSFFFWGFFKGRLKFLSEKEQVIYDLAYSQDEKKVANNKAERWQKILDQVNSEDQNAWKIGVMDADILLDEVLQEQGFQGLNVGDKLQDAESGKYETLQYAWEGHKIRNKVAHDPDYEMTKRDARTAISMYERFFNEFYH